MKKTVFLIIIILTQGSILAQGPVGNQDHGYLVVVQLKAFKPFKGKVSIYFGNKEVVKYTHSSYSSTEDLYELIFISEGYSSTAKLYTSITTGQGAPICNDTDSDAVNSKGAFDLSGCKSYFEIYPLHIEEPTITNSSPCNGALINLKYGYHWEFNISDPVSAMFDFQWQALPAKFQSQYEINVSAMELVGSEFTGNIRFRTGYKMDFTNIVTYTIIPCSPQLLNFKPQETTCSYTDDGSFSMVLDREIPLGKKLVASLFYEFKPDTKPEFYEFLDQRDTTKLTRKGDGTYIYQWPKDTPILPGKYKVRYQTFDTIVDNPEWDSLEGEEKGFIIGNPPAITFDLLEGTLKNSSCFEGNNGQIQIKAAGGDENFEYQLNTDTWKSFTTGNTHIIGQLPKGNHILKIRDGNKCIAKE